MATRGVNCTQQKQQSSSSSLSVSRAVSSQPEEENGIKTENNEQGDCRSSLPPNYKVDELDMMSKLQLARELEEDTRVALKVVNDGDDSESEMKTKNGKHIFIDTIIRKNSNNSYVI
eukprot:GFUD01022290.1.p1 GENE.GFUD01022290.1~~GFUD01022290.1.p1  ORF type:complete len:117 (+),score=36.63 GFUD01022290.1:254-604(+)